jgi:hypothetical protein
VAHGFGVTAIPIALLQRQINRRAIPVARSAPGFFRWRDYYASPFTTPLSARDMRLYGAKHLFAVRLRDHLTAALDPTDQPAGAHCVEPDRIHSR